MKIVGRAISGRIRLTKVISKAVALLISGKIKLTFIGNGTETSGIGVMRIESTFIVG